MVSFIEFCFGGEESTKSIVFNILSHESPLKIIHLKNLLSRRYGKQVTFQGVRKAVFELVSDKVLLPSEKGFLINKEWVLESKKQIDSLHYSIFSSKPLAKGMDSIGAEMTVFSFDSVVKMMQFWENLIAEWNQIPLRSVPKVNSYQAHHSWECILFPDMERNVMSNLVSRKVKSYAIITGSTPLDKLAIKFYRSIGIKTILLPSSSLFDKEYVVATYGDLVVQTTYSKEFAFELDSFFKKSKNLENLDLKKLSEIVSKKCESKLSVAKNVHMANQINKSIINQIKSNY